MKYQQLIKEYYVDINNLNQLLKTMVDSYRLLIGGAAELNNIYEAKSSYVKEAVHRANELGKIIDDVIELLEVDNDLLFQDSSVREEYEKLKTYKNEQENKLNN